MIDIRVDVLETPIDWNFVGEGDGLEKGEAGWVVIRPDRRRSDRVLSNSEGSLDLFMFWFAMTELEEQLVGFVEVVEGAVVLADSKTMQEPTETEDEEEEEEERSADFSLLAT